MGTEMNSKTVNFRKRAVHMLGLADKLPDTAGGSFAVLLPGYSEREVSQCVGLVAALLDLGCIEFCCIGNRAEELHDHIDEVIEDREQFNVVTTFHADEEEACEYFLFAAGAAEPSLVAMVLDHPEVACQLESLIRSSDVRK